MESVMQIISQYGFPIAMCVAVWFDSRKREDQLVGIIQENTAAMTSMSSAMTAMTAALDRLSSAINEKEV